MNRGPTEDEVFAGARDLPPGEREAFLREACRGDEALCRSVETLLAAHETEDVLVDTPVLESSTLSEFLTPPDQPGRPPLPDPKEGPVEFGDYLIHEEAARGAMGIVYRAEQLSLKRTVAIKMIRPAFLIGDDEVARFRSEARAAAKLNHPNIVPIFEAGEHECLHYYTMPFIEGETLRERMEELKAEPRAAVALMIKVCRAIQTAHQNGILHRDLKPGNVLIDPRGEPQVTDFGLAKQLGSRSESTREGALSGTPYCMAPEQAGPGQREGSTAIDLHSLGAILYELLAGVPPRQSDSMAMAEEEPAAPRVVNPSMDRDLETIILKSLHKEPEERYPSVGVLADELDRWLRGKPILARPFPRRNAP